TASLTGTEGTNGWYVSAVTVSLSAQDATSGVAGTEYNLDGGGWTAYAGDFEVSGEGQHEVLFRSKDRAGNLEADGKVEFQIDTLAPAVSAPDLAEASDTGSSSSDNVTKSTELVFNGTAEAGSVVRLYEGDDLVGQATAGTDGAWSITISGVAEGSHAYQATPADQARHRTTPAALTVSVNVTAPQVSGSADRAANANGWYNADVTVTFASTSADLHSLTAPVTLGEGNGQSATGTATDVAGNAATFTVSGINVDKTAPT